MSGLEVTAHSIGPQNWKNNSLKNIRLTHGLISKSDKSCQLGRTLDPLPHLREVLAELSNREAIRYARDVRCVVVRLRECFLETNEEIKALTNVKYALETHLERIRKDIKLNEETRGIRTARPRRERDQDGADDLLHAERLHLLNLKKELESNLKSVHEHLQELDVARTRVTNVLKERSRVMDLLCDSVASARNMRLFENGNALTSRPATQNGTMMARTTGSDPLSAFTPECEAAMKEAEGIRYRSKIIRGECKECIDRVQKLQQSAHKSVNDGLTRKLAETITLKQHLNMASADNRSAVNRAQRWYDTTEKARGYQMIVVYECHEYFGKNYIHLDFAKDDLYNFEGPLSSSDLMTHERLDRPIMRVFQRHPGTQVPEAQEIIKGTDGFLDSLIATSKNISLLRLADCSLRADIRDKTRAFEVDAHALRNRRRKADHHWTMGRPH